MEMSWIVKTVDTLMVYEKLWVVTVLHGSQSVEATGLSHVYMTLVNDFSFQLSSVTHLMDHLYSQRRAWGGFLHLVLGTLLCPSSTEILAPTWEGVRISIPDLRPSSPSPRGRIMMSLSMRRLCDAGVALD